MPKIDAPTVAEHRARQRAAIIAAARDALGRHGVAAVTPGAVARAAGLARTSVYQYFPSTDALLTAAIEDVFDHAATRVAQTLHGQTEPWAQVRAYVTVALHAAAGEYGPFHGITAAELPEAARVRMRELRDELSAPLIAALHQIGVPSPATTAALVGGVVGAGINLIRHGTPADEVIAACCAMVTSGIHPTRPSVAAHSTSGPCPAPPAGGAAWCVPPPHEEQ